MSHICIFMFCASLRLTQCEFYYGKPTQEVTSRMIQHVYVNNGVAKSFCGKEAEVKKSELYKKYLKEKK